MYYAILENTETRFFHMLINVVFEFDSLPRRYIMILFKDNKLRIGEV
jgi:hypothetical protein